MTAISVNNLGKKYIIGHQVKLGDESIVDDFRRMVKNIFNIHHLSSSRFMVEEFWALKNISFDVKEGERIGIIGRNGAGKSTLLKLLSRIMEPSSGMISLKGKVSTLLEVGTGFHPELTGRENIFLNGAILGMNKKEIIRKFDNIVEFAGVEKFLDTPVKRYSSGMYVRLAFAVSAHLDPDILIVDEVLAVGDAQFQKKCLGRMEEVSNEGRTVLFVSHNMAAIRKLCSRVILLENGEITAEGEPLEVIKKYLRSGLKQEGERVWSDINNAPGDDVVRLKSLRAVKSDGAITSEFSVRESWGLEIEYTMLKPGFCMNVQFYFYEESGELIFATGDFQDVTNEERQNPLPPGVHKSRCIIPENLLNEGGLRIMAAIVTTNPVACRVLEHDALYLQILDDIDLPLGGSRGRYNVKWPGGAVRPFFNWEYEYDESEKMAVNCGKQNICNTSDI